MRDSKTVAKIIEMLRSREKVGLEKYGTSIDREDLAVEDWCQHAIEELLDCVQYLQRVKDMIPLPQHVGKEILGTKVLLDGTNLNPMAVETNRDGNLEVIGVKWVRAIQDDHEHTLEVIFVNGDIQTVKGTIAQKRNSHFPHRYDFTLKVNEQSFTLTNDAAIKDILCSEISNKRKLKLIGKRLDV